MAYRDMRLKEFNLEMFPPLYLFSTLTEAGNLLGRKEIKVVAVEGLVGDWAAYCETPTSCERFGSLETHTLSEMTFTLSHYMRCVIISESGQKLRKEEAEQLFPEWVERLSWRH